jgi:hypothetical protein
VKKIISLFQRNYETDRLIRDEIVPGAEWVIAGEGVATRKLDGTSCLIRDGRLYKRYDARQGKRSPDGFEPAQPAPDPITGHWPGWLPVGDGPEDRWHREALAAGTLPDGTYELVGPKIQGNPEHLDSNMLTPHGKEVLADAPRDFDALRAYLAERDIEGIVWWRDPADPDCDKVKIKKRDYGLRRKP